MMNYYIVHVLIELYVSCFMGQHIPIISFTYIILYIVDDEKMVVKKSVNKYTV